ncbi:protein lethal(2)k10201 [Drosophila innubila]|uniref:protein lethal(2)k10201 n=1 Tax=Drosophila innubila TaxID=198719 RepID=UPI00148B4897|nr:protein lethal(2)k10201 [Drosophila innubila]
MQLETTTGLLLTKEELKRILNGFTPTYLKPTDPHISTTDLPTFKKLGVLVDLDEIPDAAETKSKQHKVNVNTAQSQSYNCIQCRRQLPTAHLLDLHITERHDLYFAASVERGDKPMFACYIEECGLKFQGPSERKDHCIGVHMFPANYRFDQENANKIKNRKQQTEDSMDVDNVSNPSKAAQLPYIKAFSFGHPTQRTFNTRKESGRGKDFLNVKEMQEALNEMN